MVSKSGKRGGHGRGRGFGGREEDGGGRRSIGRDHGMGRGWFIVNMDLPLQSIKLECYNPHTVKQYVPGSQRTHLFQYCATVHLQQKRQQV